MPSSKVPGPSILLEDHTTATFYDSFDLEKLKKFFPDANHQIQKLSEIQNHEYENKKIAALALTHCSALVYWSKDRSGIFSNEKLEFLGDAYLNFFIANYSMSLLPHLNEGDLSKLRAAVVGFENLAKKSRLLNLGSCLMFGKTEKNFSYTNQESVLADAFEAVTAALLLDAGNEVTSRWLANVFHDDILSVSKNLNHLDAKGALQQWAHSTLGTLPVYQTISVSRNTAEPAFEVSILIAGREVASARAKNKKEASKKAAEQALKQITSGAFHI